VLDAAVTRAMRVYGGYSATPTFRLRLSDGRRAFFKAASAKSTEFAHDAHSREERVYRELAPFISSWSPAFYGAFEIDGWRVMLLEDLGPKTAPPWKPNILRAVSRAFGDFHRETQGAVFPDWLGRPQSQLLTPDQLWLTVQEFDLNAVANLAGLASDDARRWLADALPVLTRVSRTIGEVGQPYSLIHRDVRSDNLRWTTDGLRLLDWPHPGVGPAEYDIVAFAQSVAVEGGAPAEQVLAWHGERFPLSNDAVDASVAALASFFASHAHRPELPGLPRLRSFQRAQLRVTLAWAARRLKLPEPVWLAAVQ
jgi:Ser/Thr protein kinase RdoA (MazF antagonist)